MSKPVKIPGYSESVFGQQLAPCFEFSPMREPIQNRTGLVRVMGVPGVGGNCQCNDPLFPQMRFIGRRQTDEDFLVKLTCLSLIRIPQGLRSEIPVDNPKSDLV
jgi:hypothetical protein